MLFFLKKVIGTVLMPLSLVLLLQLVALALLSRRRTRGAAAAAISGLLLLFTAANEGLADRLIGSLENRHPPVTRTVPADAILVLGGGHNRAVDQAATGRLSAASLARLVEAVRLARLLPKARLLMCGPAPDAASESHAALLARAAAELGIDPARITLAPEVRDTHDEVLAARARLGDTPVLLVTSAWHMPRAFGLARHAGLQAIPAPADYTTSPVGNPPGAWLRWSVFGLERTTLATREYLGLAWTRLRNQR